MGSITQIIWRMEESRKEIWLVMFEVSIFSKISAFQLLLKAYTNLQAISWILDSGMWYSLFLDKNAVSESFKVGEIVQFKDIFDFLTGTGVKKYKLFKNFFKVVGLWLTKFN